MDSISSRDGQAKVPKISSEGWLIVIRAKQFWLHVPHESLILLAAGGLSYMLGVIFYCWKRMSYGHMIWHLFVLGGSVCHYFGILLYLLYLLPTI
ncbi:hemolysin III family protein [Candidatus Bipolaricaulota bacterium]|nr:hemolysin III family protein [Candidatus Bipolaricaulota bacterium]